MNFIESIDYAQQLFGCYPLISGYADRIKTMFYNPEDYTLEKVIERLERFEGDFTDKESTVMFWAGDERSGNDIFSSDRYLYVTTPMVAVMVADRWDIAREWIAGNDERKKYLMLTMMELYRVREKTDMGNPGDIFSPRKPTGEMEGIYGLTNPEKRLPGAFVQYVLAHEDMPDDIRLWFVRTLKKETDNLYEFYEAYESTNLDDIRSTIKTIDRLTQKDPQVISAEDRARFAVSFVFQYANGSFMSNPEVTEEHKRYAARIKRICDRAMDSDLFLERFIEKNSGFRADLRNHCITNPQYFLKFWKMCGGAPIVLDCRDKRKRSWFRKVCGDKIDFENDPEWDTEQVYRTMLEVCDRIIWPQSMSLPHHGEAIMKYADAELIQKSVMKDVIRRADISRMIKTAKEEKKHSMIPLLLLKKHGYFGEVG